eukprot:CAMPEP_0174369770 /NCGR_PEP_ID=MMETSP0811_2-20130205/93675_1 /TAXON_ID=73025 ORGANISM="Eutreptiella gymnastica-like, Strain CCMP1594" /NCGR_SAMPLE_ID=MMETSP0811_2 /ASSEMBLY_ACC=CAM_ASM_000667 /LENGTH=68 /DNA_ID=CAMNT_0015514555 /DNA_START=91 /DNA_END=293 /DNA_ORIENTATION=+
MKDNSTASIRDQPRILPPPTCEIIVISKACSGTASYHQGHSVKATPQLRGGRRHAQVQTLGNLRLPPP